MPIAHAVQQVYALDFGRLRRDFRSAKHALALLDEGGARAFMMRRSVLEFTALFAEFCFACGVVSPTPSLFGAPAPDFSAGVVLSSRRRNRPRSASSRFGACALCIFATIRRLLLNAASCSAISSWSLFLSSFKILYFTFDLPVHFTRGCKLRGTVIFCAFSGCFSFCAASSCAAVS